MEFVAYSPIMSDGAVYWLLGILAIIVVVPIVALLAFVVWRLKYPMSDIGKIAWVFGMLLFFPFGMGLYFLAYFLFGRNAQGGIGANREEGNFLVECRQCGEGILRNVESCTNCGEPRPVG